jgi:site-specific DNA-cytosine methylase
VLIACEFSGIVRDAFIAKGHDAWSCDLLPTERTGPHIQGDVLDAIQLDQYDLMIAHPPCTHLAVSGARWFKDKLVEQAEALEFVRLLLDAPIDKIALENPVSIISSRIRKPDQIIQPFQFGDPFRKTTCLWLKNLPKLIPTDIVKEGPRCYYPSGKSGPEWYMNAPIKTRKKLRATTFSGIAKAMATQWGDMLH